MSDKYELSRRKALAALGTIGVAGAGAGMGTSALFSDEEEFTNNSIDAGTLNLVVDYEEEYSWDSGTQQSESGTTGTKANDGPVTKLIDLGDVKPGDQGYVQFDLDIIDNPGYLWMFGRLNSANENGKNEPEKEVEDDLPNSGDGVPGLEANKGVELLDEIQVVIKYGTTGSVDQPIFSGSLRDALDRLNVASSLGVWGIPLDGQNGGSYGAGYNETQNASGAPLNQGVSTFLEPGVNAFNDFESGGNYVLSASVEEDEPSSGTVSSAAHAVSDGKTKDYVTSIIGDVPGSGNSTFKFDWEAGTNNENNAPDEVYAQFDTGSDTKYVSTTLNPDSGESVSDSGPHTRTVDLGATTWIDLEGNSFNSSDSSDTLERIGVGRGNTGTAKELDVYYWDPRIDGSSIGSFPTKQSEYRGRNTFAASSSTNNPRKHPVRFEWEVPQSVDNRIQSDSVNFDLGFLAVQGRNNDGSL